MLGTHGLLINIVPTSLYFCFSVAEKKNLHMATVLSPLLPYYNLHI